MSAALKTPISLLQELCVQKGITAEYKLMSVEGAVHAPTFMYRVQVGESVATATGASKKKAKHAVALAVLEKILSEQGPFPEGFQSDGIKIDINSLKDVIAESGSVPVITPSVVPSEENSGPNENPVGALQELCMKQHWQPPYYETESEDGLPHERLFTIACYVERLREIGTGKSKRLAKREAANLMLQRLHSLKLTEEKMDEEKDTTDSADDEKGIRHNGHRKPNVHSVYRANIEEFLMGLKTSTSKCLLALQDTDLNDENLDCINLLDKVAAEQEFELFYIPIDQKGKSGNYNCIVKINSLPVAIMFGSGPTPEEAKSNCARNALNYIQMTCTPKK